MEALSKYLDLSLRNLSELAACHPVLSCKWCTFNSGPALGYLIALKMTGPWLPKESLWLGDETIPNLALRINRRAFP